MNEYFLLFYIPRAWRRYLLRVELLRKRQSSFLVPHPPPCQFTVGSRPDPRVFLSFANSKFHFDQDRGTAWKPTKSDAASSPNIVIFISVACNTLEIITLINVFLLFKPVVIIFCQITTNALIVRVRTVERVSTHLAATDVNVTMDTAGKTVI